MTEIAATDEAWRRLGEMLIAARVAKGFTRRAEFVRHLGLTHGRTLLDVENAKRRNFDPSTLAFIEQAYGWRSGSIRTVLAGGEPTPVSAASTGTLAASAPIDVMEAIRRDPHLLPEARAHLVNQYGLLLRIQGAAAQAPPPIVEVPTDAEDERLLLAAYQSSPEAAEELRAKAREFMARMRAENDEDQQRATGG